MKLNAPSAPAATEPSAPPAAASALPAEAKQGRGLAIADGVLMLMALALAFLLASFAARNADVWLHLAIGRLLTQGQYAFGVDPLSYATAGRYWANPAWLFDLLEFQIYSRLGAVALVALKAVAITFAAGLLLAIRRRGQAAWPWVLSLVLALLAAAPKMLLAPYVASLVCFAMLLFLLFRVNGSASSWKLPLLVGGLCALWSNLDEWFFLGPLTVALLLLGSTIQKLRKVNEADEIDSPFGPAPATNTLVRTLLVSILASMVNPHHVHVWQLPIEITHSTAMANEPLFQRQILLGPLDGDYSDLARNGRNINGAAYLILFVGGGLVLGLGGGRLRLGHLLLWLAFAVLSLRTVAMIPFFALLCVPLLAGQLNSLTTRWDTGDVATGSRTPVSAIGRGVGIVVLGVLLVLAWPGWLHPTPDFESDTPRVAWGVVPDPTMQRTAEQIEAWRKDGTLTPEDRGVLLSTPLGNYCAWFAPSEKVFVNTRYRFHEPELPEYTRLRSNIGTRSDRSAPANMVEVAATFQKHGVSYVALFEAGRFLGRSVTKLLRDEPHWALWSLGGRAAVLGWRASPGTARPSFETLRLSPAGVVLAATTPRPTSTSELLQPQTFLDDFFSAAAAAPTEADEAIVWLEYKNWLTQRHRQIQAMGLLLANTGQPFDPLITQLLAPTIGISRTGDELLISVVALRAARQAIAANPDHPEGYFALMFAIAEPTLVLDEATRGATRVFAMQECLRLAPPPTSQSVRSLSFSPTNTAGGLAMLFEENSRLNLAEANAEFASFVGTPQVRALASVRQSLQQAIQFASSEIDANTPERATLLDERDRWSEALKKIEKELQNLNGQYDDFRARNPRVRDGYFYARRLGLTEKALQLLAENDLRKEFGNDWPLIAVQQVALEMYLGRVRDADQHLAVLNEAIQKGELTHSEIRVVARKLAMMLSNIVGNYRNAGSLLDSLTPENIGLPDTVLKPYLPYGDFNVASPLLQAGPAFGTVAAALQGYQRSVLLFSSLRQRREAEADFHFDRGLLALYEGDNARAREEFQKAMPTPRPGWPLPLPRQAALSRQFLQLMQADKPTKN